MGQTTDECILEYSSNLDFLTINVWYDLLSCNDFNCQNPEHNVQLELIVKDSKDIIFAASEGFTLIGRPNKKQVVGWNKFFEDLYSEARHIYLRRHEAGCIRSG